MNDLNTLLERAAGPVATPVDARADLARGQRALARTRRRRGAVGLAGVAAAGVVGIGAVRVLTPDHGQGDEPATAKAKDSHHARSGGGVSLLAQPFAAGPFTFDQAPEGWEVQGSYPQGVTIAPVGFPDQEPLSFEGKLVIMFDGNPLGGHKVELDGRAYGVSEDSDYTTIAVRTRADEPSGVVRIQYPTDAGWTRDTMLAFLAGVHVGAGAQQGLG
jgi:hypothetical protein